MDSHVQSGLAASAPERARALIPLLEAHGPEIDHRRELTPEAVDALHQADLLRLLLPRNIGGQEISLLDFARTTEAVAMGDASTAWFVCQSNVSAGSSAAAMSREAAVAIFDGPRTGLAWGAKHSRSKAIRVEGGYRLTGEWSFGSGSRHVTWIGAHSNVQNPDGTPHIRHGRPDDRSFLFLRSKAKITDDWHVLGLRGTGSDSYAVEDLFIPDEHAPARDAPEERREQGPLYTYISNLLYASGFAGVSLGVARRMLDSLIGLARGKQNRAAINAMAQNHAIQKEVALLEAQLGAARAYLHEAIGESWQASQEGRLDIDARMKLRLATTYTMNQATDVSIACYRMAGTTAILDSAPFERRFRDAMAVSQHLQAMSAHLEMVGRHLIGAENVVQWV